MFIVVASEVEGIVYCGGVESFLDNSVEYKLTLFHHNGRVSVETQTVGVCKWDDEWENWQRLPINVNARDGRYLILEFV